MNQHDLQFLHRIGRINIQGTKLVTPCDYCLAAKTARKEGNGPTPRATRAGMRLHIDIFGGGKTLGLASDDDVPPANGKWKFAMILTDDVTRMRWIIPLMNRDNPVHIIKSHIEWMRKMGYETAYPRGDNEFFKSPERDWRGFKVEPTVPYTPWQNGVSERGIRILLERTRAALCASKLPRRFWLEALMDTVNKTNHLPTSTPLFNDPTPNGSVDNKEIKKSPYSIPYEAWLNQRLDISYLRPFGTTVWLHKHGSNRQRQDGFYCCTRLSIGSHG